MGVVNLPSGRPTMELTGGAKRRLEAITPAGYEARIDLTITDEGPMAQAFVIIWALAGGRPEHAPCPVLCAATDDADLPAPPMRAANGSDEKFFRPHGRVP